MDHATRQEAPDDGAPARILAVFAHPDDESLACGGTLACLAAQGSIVMLVCASRGELGTIADAPLTPDVDLGAIRVHEIEAAAKALGIGAIDMLGYPDGNLRWGGEGRLRDDLVGIINHWQPAAVITFDDDGLYWHADHIAVHEHTTSAVLASNAGEPALYYVTLPPGLMGLVEQRAVERQWVRPATGLWSIDPFAFGAAAKPPSFAVDVRQWVPQKLAALQCHQTQVGVINPFSLLDHLEATQWLGFEYFRRAPTAGGDRRVLEGLSRIAGVDAREVRTA